MRLLIDQNLSRHLVERLRDPFPGSTHVTSVGLDAASDRDLWECAAEHGYVLVSRDSDFRQLAFMYGPPPKVVWLRAGNVATSRIVEMILDSIEVIEEFVDSADEALLVISGDQRFR